MKNEPVPAAPAAPAERDAAGFRGFESEAGELMSRASTRRAQTIVHAAVLVVVLLLVWAALAEVDEITQGEARVISSRQLQLVQSLDGGVVSEILVKEGQVVEKDQLLLKIDETRATSGVRESAAQGFALRARQAR
ncbi:MAG TPA: biotin/lipoyl-binding protein, partial [Burkholderiaceae bacterium]